MTSKSSAQISLRNTTQSQEYRPRTSEMSCGSDERKLESTSEQETNTRHLSGQVTHQLGSISNGITNTTLRASRNCQNSGRSRLPPLTKTYEDATIGSKSMNQTTFEMNSHQLNSASSDDTLDIDVIPQVSTFSRKFQYDMADECRRAATPLNSDMAYKSHTRKISRQTYIQSNSRRPVTPIKQPGLVVKMFGNMFSFSNGSPTGNSNLEQQLSEKDLEIAHFQEALCKADVIIQDIQKGYQRDFKHLEQEFQQALHDQQRQFEARENDLIQSIQKLQAELQKLKLDRNTIQEKYDTVIRIQQEKSFEQMESGRWLPSEESKVVDNLDRIRREMKGWAKATSIKDMSLLQTLDGLNFTILMEDLSNVVLLENNQLPQGLSTPKSPSLLLNALLSHDVYTTIFRSPFFFLNEKLGNEMPRAGVEDALQDIYQSAQASNEQDAHIWRSQLLRLLLPPLRRDSRFGETFLRNSTEAMIAKVSERQASKFIAGSAHHFINNNIKSDYAKKLKAIYQEAASLSYQLWTRRTTMKCDTLREMNHPKFDANSSYLVPHNLVRYDDHDDLLAERPITVIVHPLLQVYGTDEGKDYDKGRIWAPAEVWLDSK